MGFIDRPSADTTVTAFHPPGPSPRLRFGTATSRTRSALAVPPGFSGFLRSERIRRPTRSTACGFVAPRSRPWGSPRFGLPARSLDRAPTRRSWTSRSIQASSPVAKTLRSVPLPGSLQPCRHRVSSFRTRSRSPAGVPSRRFEPCPFACRHALEPCPPTSRPFSTEESVATRATLPRRARSMLPWALDRLVPMLPRVPRSPSVFDWTFRLAVRTASASLDPNVEGRQGVSALSGSCDPSAASVPEGMIAAGRGGSGISRRRRLGRTPPRAPKDRWNASGSAPRGGPTASAPAPEGVGVPASSRRISEETRTRPSARSEERRPVVRARAPHPSAVARVPDGETARRTHARPEACARARHSRAPRRVLRRTPRRAPEGVRRAASRGRHPEVDPWRLVTPASPASWRAGSGQTVIVFTGTAETRSEDEVPPPIRRSE
jgi:hypothetical protein